MREEYLAPVIRTMLAEGVYSVIFIKADGSERVMLCTTKHDLIAEACGRDYTPGSLDESKPPKADLVMAYDLDVLGWRSFHASSVLSIEPFFDINGNHITKTLDEEEE